jgi:drug/metabolite transporter (DMT)-like permease
MKRIRSATEWGLFFGVLSWLLATAVTNQIPGWGVLAIVLDRAVTGTVLGIMDSGRQWMWKGALAGGIIGLPVAWMSWFWPEFNTAPALAYMILSSVLSGFFINLVLHRRKSQEAASE